MIAGKSIFSVFSTVPPLPYLVVGILPNLAIDWEKEVIFLPSAKPSPLPNLVTQNVTKSGWRTRIITIVKL